MDLDPRRQRPLGPLPAESVFKQAVDIYGRFLLEQQAEMYERGSIFSISDPELRALELSTAEMIREHLALRSGGPGSSRWAAECGEFGCHEDDDA